jgi:hypothetical protein
MIKYKNETVTSRITVCNYERYQNHNTVGQPQSRRRPSAHETQARTNNNVNNENNGNKPTSFFSSNSFKRQFKTFDEIDREQAKAALEKASREFLADD